MSTGPTNAEKIRRLPWILGSDGANSAFCQLTVFGPVFILFLDQLGLDKTQIGFLLSLFPFCGLIALFIAPVVARVGFKRTFIIFWGTRKVVVGFLLLTPWILSRFGFQGTFVFVAGILLLFALCRAIGETAWLPWIQEAVPNSIRGKFSALNNMVGTSSGVLAVGVASYVVGHSTGLGRFMGLIAAGVVVGFVSVLCAALVPGGAPLAHGTGRIKLFQGLMGALRDRNFRLYLSGAALVTLGSGPLLSFLPLFMKEQVGLGPGEIVLLQTWVMIGGLLSSYLWGWSADRYGSKPVMLSGMYMTLLLPMCWALMPRHSIWSSSAAVALALVWGLSSTGMSIGSNRLFFVSIVPPERKMEYMAMWYAWIGLIGGCGPLIAGRILDYSKGVQGRFFLLALDPYTPLFAVSLALLAAGAVVFYRRIQPDSTVTARKLTTMFLRGNPFMALESLVRYKLAKHDGVRVSMTERMGTARSPLNVDELIEALSDPSFNVRYEAIISATRTHRDERLVEPLVEILCSNHSDLGVVAAWALGRMGDKRAIEPLRQALVSGQPLCQAHSARALGALGDVEAIPLLLERLRSQSDHGLRVAYASALGSLRAKEAAADLLTLLRTIEDEVSRMEVALALARIVGGESHFLGLWRQARAEIGTAASRALLSLRKKMRSLHLPNEDLMRTADNSARTFGEGDLARGAPLIGQMVAALPLEEIEEPCSLILRDCRSQLREFGATRTEYLLLSLHAIDVGLNHLRRSAPHPPASQPQEWPEPSQPSQPTPQPTDGLDEQPTVQDELAKSQKG